FLGDGLELGPLGAKAPLAGDRLRRHEADVVAVVRVFRPGIAEAGDDDHGSAPNMETAPSVAGGAVAATRVESDQPSLVSSAAAGSAATFSSAMASSISSAALAAEEVLIAAIMKSRSVMVGSTPSG